MEKKLPNKPGVYLFKDPQNTIIYVGKATNLRSRVQSYFQKQGKDWKIDSLIAEHATIEHIVTGTETEASLLEAHLIKMYQPKYNVLLKNGQPFVYIMFTDGPLSTMELVRNKKKKGTYFGPFLQKRPAKAAFNYLASTFRLKLCNKKIEHGCLDYHIGTCAGNCRSDFDIENYKIRLTLAMNTLKKDHEMFKKTTWEHIKLYSAEQSFEKAKMLHDYLANIDTIFSTLELRFSPQKYAAQVSAATMGCPPATATTNIAQEVQQFLGMDKPIVTIDCFDISHFQSDCLVGSCIRFTYGIPDPHKFRRFKIKTLTEQNDYAALAEIVSRRYRNPADLPDIILIDGGKGQLHAIENIMRNTPCISLAKKDELLFCSRYPDGIYLDIQSSVGKLMIALRDYAHHFAIEYHRKKKRQLF
jgi:excinuclease ABC subunit C